MRTQSGKYIHPWGAGLMKNKVRWYVVANRTDASIYTEERDTPFSFLKRVSDPLGKMMERNLDSDRPGRGFSSARKTGRGVTRHALDRTFKRHETAGIRFARRVAQVIAEASWKHEFHELVLISEPRFLGYLRTELPLSVKKKIKKEIRREWVDCTEYEIQKLLAQTINRGGSTNKDGRGRSLSEEARGPVGRVR